MNFHRTGVAGCILSSSFADMCLFALAGTRWPILEQLRLEEALFRADKRNWYDVQSPTHIHRKNTHAPLKSAHSQSYQ